MIQNITALIVAVGGVLPVMVGCTLAIIREIRVGRRETAGKVQQVHEIVNGRASAQSAYVAELVSALNEAGAAVPPPPIDPLPDPGAGTPHSTEETAA